MWMVFKNRKQRRNVDKEENDQDLALGPPTLRFGRAAKMAKKLKGTPTMLHSGQLSPLWNL